MNATTTQAIAEYSQTEAALTELRAKFSNVIFDVATSAGDKAAREARQTLVKLRTGLEAKRKEIKQPALAYAKAIDTEAGRIEGEIRALEEPIDAQIKAREAQVAAEKAERERIERERVAAIQTRMQRVRNLPIDSVNHSAAELAAVVAKLEAFEVLEAEFAEFFEDATVVRGTALAQLTRMHETATIRERNAAELERERQEQQAREEQARAAREAEAAKLAAERAEFERQRQEQEERDQQARAELDRQIREQEAQARKEREEIARQREEFAAQQRAAAAEAQAKADVQAARDAETARAKEEQEAAWQAEQDRIQRETDEQIAAEAAHQAQQAQAPAPAEACATHGWLHDEPVSPCTFCADDAAAAEKAANLRIYTADDMRAAFIAGSNWAGGNVEMGATRYVAGLEAV